jgi:phospholipid/cholesterol/gamma-HCH transport system substrate-binding protein
MEKDAKYFVAGLFVSLTLLALVVFVIWLAGIHRTGDYVRYTIYFTDPVSGLNKEGSVRYNGVEVGKILAMRLATNRSDLVKVDIEVEESTPIHGKTTAKIAMQGITGLNYIELSTEVTDKTSLPRLPDEKYPVLKGTGNMLSTFLDELPKMSQQFLETLAAIDELSKGSAKTVESIRALTDKLKEDPSQVVYPPSRKGVEIPK